MSKDKIKTIKIDLVEEIELRVLSNSNFNSSDWCERDGNILKKAGEMILRELYKKNYENST